MIETGQLYIYRMDTKWPTDGNECKLELWIFNIGDIRISGKMTLKYNVDYSFLDEDFCKTVIGDENKKQNLINWILKKDVKSPKANAIYNYIISPSKTLDANGRGVKCEVDTASNDSLQFKFYSTIHINAGEIKELTLTPQVPPYEKGFRPIISIYDIEPFFIWER